MDFGEKLKKFGKDRFGSLSALAEVLEISQPHLSQYVAGINKPGKDFFVKLHNLGCDINWLLSEEDTNKVKEGGALYGPAALQQELQQLKKANKELRDILSKINKLTGTSGT